MRVPLTVLTRLDLVSEDEAFAGRPRFPFGRIYHTQCLPSLYMTRIPFPGLPSLLLYPLTSSILNFITYHNLDTFHPIR